jgi:hypothetical protein
VPDHCRFFKRHRPLYLDVPNIQVHHQARVMFEQYCKDGSPLLDHRNRWCGFEQRQASLTKVVWPSYPRVSWVLYFVFCILYFVFCFCFCWFLIPLCFWYHYGFDVTMVLFLCCFVLFCSFFDVTMRLMSLCPCYKNLVAVLSHNAFDVTTLLLQESCSGSQFLLRFSVFVFLCTGCLS